MIEIFKLDTYKDNRGCLSVVEGGKTVPFEIKRAFFTYAPSSDTKRGGHANIDSSFLMINVAGSCKLRYADGETTDTVSFDSPMEAALLPALTWKELFDYSSDSVVLFLSDKHYNKEDYIYDFDEFVKAVNSKRQKSEDQH